MVSIGVSSEARVQEGMPKSRLRQLADAMALMQQALSLLDQADDADSSSVHLDLAIERLRDIMSNSSPRGQANPPDPGFSR